MTSDQAAILDFWFRETPPRQWFQGGEALDEIVTGRFGGLLEEALAGRLDSWASDPRGRLALILLLDQFARHVHRGTGKAHAGDVRAQRLAQEGIERGMDEDLTFDERQFFYMPLMHAEDPALQELSIAKFGELEEYGRRLLGFAENHRDIVARFGRFPLRNQRLGRTSTQAEADWLSENEGYSAE